MAIPTFAEFSEESSASSSPFKLHIAVDIGTDGTIIAYAYNGQVFIHNLWSSKKYADEVKAKTSILIDNKGKVLGFGADAKFNYMSVPFQKSTWMLFERFKMALYEEDARRIHKHEQQPQTEEADEKKDEQVQPPQPQQESDSNSNGICIANTLTATNGSRYPAEFVFVAVFKYIESEAFQFLRAKRINVEHIAREEIQWIITVPAIWNDVAKHKMKEWAISAGLIKREIVDQCKIVYEPDSAALSLQYQMHRESLQKQQKQKQQNGSNHHNHTAATHQKQTNGTNHNHTSSAWNMQVGDKYILIDAGGGTVDIACHEILASFGVKEVLCPSGGPWGSCYIDDEYIKLLREVFSAHWIQQFKAILPNVYVELVHNFQSAKCTFYTNSHSKQRYNVRLPTDFCSFIEERIAELDDPHISEIEHIVDRAKILGFSNLLSFSDEYLSIDVMVWRWMFDRVINPITLHVQQLLNEVKLMRKCKSLCLVGGLSCSPYFQHKMRQHFGPKSRFNLNVIIPRRPLLCVVEGAAYFGITRNYIKARVLRKTYGIKASFKESKARLLGVNAKDIAKNRIYIKYYDSYFVKNCFKVLARKNCEIRTNQIVRYSCKRQPGSQCAKIIIVCSDLEHPKMVHTDGHILAKLKLEFNTNQNENENENEKENAKTKMNMNIHSEFHFYDTTLKVIAYCDSAPHIRKEAEIRYVAS